MRHFFNATQFEACIAADLHPTEAFLSSDMTVADARVLWLKQSLLKKYIPNGLDTKPLEKVTMDLFMDMNARCVDSFLVDNFDSQELLALNIMRDKLYFWSRGVCQSQDFSLFESLNNGRTGPGAAVGECDSSFYSKMFASTLTHCNPALVQHYQNSISGNWHLAEHLRALLLETRRVAGSTVAYAPKTRDILRLISPQPVLEMFYQLGTGVTIERWLKKWCSIDLSLQPDVNRDMARLGSINGKFATIDLKSASDSISCSFLKHVLPHDLFAFLSGQRCEHMVLPNGELLKLEMFSTMGNGFTFPLQTMVFAALVESAYATLGIKTIRHGSNRNYSVFGDDIIVCSDAYSFVCRLLERCGFQVNSLKSFGTGSFRESCGSDYFRGQNIRGVYLRKVNSSSDIYSLVNRLLRWCCGSGVMLPKTIAYLRSQVQFRPVPYHCSDNSGFKIPLSKYSERKVDRNGATWYTPLVPVTYSVSREDGTFKPDTLYNPPGLLIAFLGGYIRSGRDIIRKGDITFKAGRRRVSPCWEYDPSHLVDTREYEVVCTALLLRE